MKTFIDYLSGNTKLNSLTEASGVKLPRDVYSTGLLINTSNKKLNVGDVGGFSVAPKEVVKFLADHRISGIQDIDDDDIEDLATTDEINAFLVKKGVPAPIADYVAYDLWYSGDADRTVVIDPARYHISIDDDEMFIRNAVEVFSAVLHSTHSLGSWGGIQAYVTNGDGEYDWVWPSSMGIY